VRVYVELGTGERCLVDEHVGVTDFPLPHASSGRFVVSVIPRSGSALGREYFSQSIDLLAMRLFELPDTRAGGTQQIQAPTLEEAEQIAIARGTWTPGAGTLGTDAFADITHYPPAENLCRGA
jgi:hypothetical protein